MAILENILFFINKISFAILIIMLPFGIYDFLAGRIRAEMLLEKLKIPFTAKFIDTIALISLLLSFVTYIILDLIKNGG